MIPSLTTLAERLGVSVAFIPLALAAVLTATVLLVQSIAEWFEDWNS